MLSIWICKEKEYKEMINLFETIKRKMNQASTKYNRKMYFHKYKLDLIKEFKIARRENIIPAELLLQYESALRLTELPTNADSLLRLGDTRTYGVTRLVLNGDNNLTVAVFLTRHSDSKSSIVRRIRIDYEYKKDDTNRPYARINYQNYVEFDDRVSVDSAINTTSNLINNTLIERLCTLICDSAIDTLESVELGDKYAI